MSKRIIVFGSRDWADRNTVDFLIKCGAHRLGWKDVTIVHGACPRGADAMAAGFAFHNECKEEQHPADWAKHGRAAGPIRNQEMVDAGADMALGFILNESRGSLDMLARLRKARIETRVVFAYTEPKP